ncbi:MAG: protein kinase, partial [Polyangiaceae bacterium]|nr:protein kinase [Polyangiaceae bacterium]
MAYPAPEGTELIRRLGAGTMFDVALVRDEGRVLVCKRLTSRMAREAAGRAALVREAMALGLARHPALPAVVRVGRDGHGPFVLETALEGVPLRGLVEGWRARGKAVPLRLAAHVVRAAVEVLAEVQELRDEAGAIDLVHGDLGPDHVLLGPLGDIRLIDFGAARFRGMDAALVGEDRGTLPYVAPEVARGEASPSAQADVYALAATLLYVVSGGPICRARDEATMLVEVGEKGVRVDRREGENALTSNERAALRSALALDPAARPGSARALLAAFGADPTQR